MFYVLMRMLMKLAGDHLAEYVAVREVLTPISSIVGLLKEEEYLRSVNYCGLESQSFLVRAFQEEKNSSEICFSFVSRKYSKELYLLCQSQSIIKTMKIIKRTMRCNLSIVIREQRNVARPHNMPQANANKQAH